MAGLKTPASGAQAERDAIRAWVKRKARALEFISCLEILAYLDSRKVEFRKRPGGLGRSGK